MRKSLLNKLQTLLPSTKFVEASNFYWSPQAHTVYMNSTALESEDGQWALIHETAHALLNHENYQNDAGLLLLEVDAWQKAQELGHSMNITIDDDHIEDCLNTYRDWLYARSTCPTCMLNSLQIDETTYLCLNCSTRWSVSQSRFCRPYRMQDRHKKTYSEVSQIIFS